MFHSHILPVIFGNFAGLTLHCSDTCCVVTTADDGTQMFVSTWTLNDKSSVLATQQRIKIVDLPILMRSLRAKLWPVHDGPLL